MRTLPGAVLIVMIAARLSAAQAEVAAAPPAASLEQVFTRLYNCDFRAAHALLDDYARTHPDDPLAWSVRAATYTFAEFDRLRILQTTFFLDDETLVDDKKVKLKPDAELKKQIFAAVDAARLAADRRLAKKPDDRDALLALCMAANVVTDYTTLVERRRWRGVGLAKQSVAAANKLLALDPPVYDAYTTTGGLEYIVGSMPFYLRWFIHYDKVEGNKRKGIEELKLVARHGRFYAPFARVLLAVISLRENKLEDARQLLAGLASEFPENPLFPRELAQVNERIKAAQRKR